MASLHPTDGVRIVLERASVEGAAARYRVTVYEPEERSAAGAATIDGGVELAWDAEPPPAWVVAFLTRFLLGMPKKHADDGSWPRKITRWRAER